MKQKHCGIILLCVLSLCACTGKQSYDPKTAMVSTIKSGEKGEDGFIQLDVKGISDKMNANEDFVVMVSSSTCSHCNNMKLLLYPYLSEYKNIPFYEVEIDQLGNQKQDVNGFIEELEKLIGFKGGTPEFFHIKDKEVQASKSGELSKIDWHAFMIECGYVAEDQVITVNELAQSEYLEDVSFTEIANKIENGNEFYVLCVENDRYGAMFSNTLKAYIEEHKQNIKVLNFTSPKNESDEEQMQKSYESVVNTLQLQLTPSLYKIKDKQVVKELVDNASAQELAAWFAK